MAAAGGVYLAYAHDMQRINQRITGESRLVTGKNAPVEISDFGTGPAILSLHGSGGGYDQARLIATALGGDGFRWIAPSRFGYLRTPLPTDASTAAQADALAELLDGLGIEKVAILGMSGGVPPALQFALRYPGRISALVLVSSAPYTPLTLAQQKLPLPAWAYQALFRSDFPFWVLKKIARGRLEAIFDIKPDVRAVLTPEEKAFLARVMDSFLPVSQRVAGVGNEGAAIDPGARYRLEDIKAPTLVIHARDDGINAFALGEYTARHIPGAEFMALPSGGHLLLGHHSRVRARINAFLRAHTKNG
ncbi:hypothetical protein AYO42_03350 [Rhizomicrobium sp. SCGC AG-212-E05]|nr:hypothetical protein AYO42_03350 [Rhizomicrobium sp. SCGC AG-212-E05]